MEDQKEVVETAKTDNGAGMAITAMGILFSLMNFVMVPIIFMPIGIIFGIGGLFIKGREDKAIMIIIISIACGLIAAHIGGWGLGLGKFGDN